MEDKEEKITSNSSKIEEFSPKIVTKQQQQQTYSDRLKRDEWSEGAVSCLLEAYEAKWILRNRAKLKGQDWEDVARRVTARGGSSKSPKTQTQCKNKIESMKKRYRSESAAATAETASSWPLYPRLDLLLRGSTSASAAANPVPPPPPPPPLSPAAVPVEAAAEITVGNGDQNSRGSNDSERRVKEDTMGVKLSDNASDKNGMDTNSSTPALYSDKSKSNKKVKSRSTPEKKRKRKRGDQLGGWEIAESIRLLAEVVVRSEQARMETLREIERMRAEAEAKRGEMDLKRTEIIANTQLEIAKLFASISTKGSVDSSLRIGRS